MPGLAIQIAGVTFSAANIQFPGLPSAGNTVLWSYLGGDLPSSQNVMPGAPAITAVGSPTFGPGTVRVSAANYLDTGLLDTSKSFTTLFAAKIQQATGTCAPLTFSQASQGVYTSWSQTAGMTVGTNGIAASITNFAIANASTAYKLIAVAYDDTQTRLDLYNLTDNTTTGVTGNHATRTLASTAHVLLGQRTESAPTTGADIAFAGKVDGAAWTLAQCQQAATNIRAVLATRPGGIVV